MSIHEITLFVDDNKEKLAGLGSTIRFDFGEQGTLFLDGSANPATIRLTDEQAACTVTITPDNLLKMINGNLNPMMAFTLGKLSIAGDMGVGMKLSQILG